MKAVLALDLGTTGNRVIAFSRDGEILAKSYYEFPQIFPKPGWVEHNPQDIVDTTFRALKDVLSEVGAENVEAIGITNQRETTVLWDRRTGKPIYNAIVWQCRRTADICKRLADREDVIRAKTGLPLDPYFSATKILWLFENVPEANKLAESGNLAFGTIDTWILWNLTGGKVHATEPSNASRTLLFNIRERHFDAELLDIFGVPESILPEVRPSGSVFGETEPSLTGGRAIPISGILGDQQASLFAQGGWQEGVVKNTYGTGLFAMTSTGNTPAEPGKLVSTVAWEIDGETTYALEGSVFVGGSSVQWLRDGLKIIENSADTEPLATSLASNEGVYFVPALVGLGAPYWDPTARGMIIGLTRGTRREHLARATLEAIAYQTRDVVEEMQKLVGKKLSTLRVDGGASQNNFLMQFQADILDAVVERPVVTETTALGAAGIAGITAGVWTWDDFLSVRKIDRVFEASLGQEERERLYAKWKEAVKRARGWADV
ncbi:MAG: glycerol kinase GlpK [Calditrichaeota bacterium]|nr:glycerol kinase GlpK [Calditrichota bacterium]